MGVCETCVKNGSGRIFYEAELRMHRDNFPNHEVVSLDFDNVINELTTTENELFERGIL